jgi:hypothetical protein
MRATFPLGNGPAPLSVRWALLVALVVGGGSAYVVLSRTNGPADIDQVWFAAKAILGGRDPYALIGPGREFDQQFPFYYPLPAAIIMLPFAPVPVLVVRLVFAAGSGALLAYCVARYDWRWLLLFLSRTYWLNLWYVQWGTVLTCALFMPWVGLFFTGKPTNGAAMLAAFRDKKAIRTAIIAALIPLAIAFIAQPLWISRWLAVLTEGQHLRPFIMLPGGFLLLLAAFRWRCWEGRLLLGLSLVPQTLLQYGALPLLLIPRQRWGTVLLAALTFVPNFLAVRPPFNSRIADALSRDDFTAVTSTVGMLTLWTVYVPTLVFVLWPRHQPMNPGTNTRAPDPGAAPTTA